MRNNIKFKRITKVVCFMMIFVLSLISASYMLAPKDNTAEGGINNPNANGFFSEPENTIDIAVIGNSDAYSGFSPMELWNKYGYTSYVSAEGQQNVAKSYVMFKKILEHQSPKLIILETDGFFTKTKFTYAVANIINASLGSPFSVFQYHNRWKTVMPEQLLKKPEYTAHCITKGQKLSNEIRPYNGGEYMNKTKRCAEIPLATQTALDRFVKSCREKNIQLMFLELPSKSSWNGKRHNAVKQYADKNGVPFLDLNIDRERFDFDWKKDTRDRGNHLNNSGARKSTLFIGKYLNENYKLTDRRNDVGFEQWHKDYNEYKKLVKI